MNTPIYSATDPAHGNRATGAEVCLTSLTNGSSASKQPPGYQWAKKYVEGSSFGASPSRFAINACHLIPDKGMGGSGKDLRNLSTCGRSVNANRQLPSDPGMPDNMRAFEIGALYAVREGETVHYRVTPIYDGDRTVPAYYLMESQGVTADGEIGLDQSDLVPNVAFSPVPGQAANIGKVSVNGKPVPLGSTP
ncbi:DNA/RNA non-specific endonuclease [Streptomyces sp. NBC_01136]|uniref:DNA/RNA non-specific endonuclease n=1 Tax=unclassified Streptomyces TaxID=2593676 RepID=UPI00324D19AA|nr:DNA/RNA non-specific endonuclease [Streptomyces sp. NBC_01136]